MRQSKLVRALCLLFVFVLLGFNLSAALAGSLTETTRAEFNSGTYNNTESTNFNGGEVRLEVDSDYLDVPVALIQGVHSDHFVRPKMKVGNDGTIYVTWHEDMDDGSEYNIYFSRSEDGGETWIPPVKVDHGDYGGCQIEEKVTSILPDIALDEHSGNTKVYIVWTDDRAVGAGCGFMRFFNVYFSASIDRGSSWSNDVKVNNWPSLNGLFTGIGGSFLSYMWSQQLFWRIYSTGGPRITVGPSPNYDILVTWMNDEVNPMDYDIYYSKADADDYPAYVFDADWTTECDFLGGVVWPHYEMPGEFCEDAKIDDNTSETAYDPYSGVPAIDADQSSGKVTVAYEDTRKYAGRSLSDIMYVQFNEWGAGNASAPTIPNILPPFAPTPYPVWIWSSPVNDMAGENSYFDYEPDLDDHEPSNNVFFTWTRAVSEDGPYYPTSLGSMVAYVGNPLRMGLADNVMYDYYDGVSTHTDVVVDDDPMGEGTAMCSDIEADLDDANHLWMTWIDYGHHPGVTILSDYSTDKGMNWKTDVLVPQMVVADLYQGFPDAFYDYFADVMHIVWDELDTNDLRVDGTTDEDPYASRSLDSGKTWGGYYENSGEFTSRAVDLSAVENINYDKVSWSEDLNTGDVRVQMRTAETQAGLAGENYVGPAGTGVTYYSTPSGESIYSGHDGDSWMQYFVRFTLGSNWVTPPYLKDITFTYDIGAGGDDDADDDTGDDDTGDDDTGNDTGDDDTGDDTGDDDTGNDTSDDDGGEFDGFTDVDPGDPNYDAIMFVGEKGIFGGDPDGGFAPNRAINRAETAKVILGAFDYPIYDDPGTNLGFPDLETGEWYMQYVFTAFAFGIMEGYPDSTMKPAQTVNKVEMLKIFLLSAGEALAECEVNPYYDTDMTEWYCKYARFAKLNDLVDTDSVGNLNPDEGMKRADVAELFYRYDLMFGL
ncbi:MAG: S-layer homology domain-containing protein [Candidatus Peregrinibacteria bacterium]